MAIKSIADLKKKVAEKGFTGDGEGAFLTLKDGDAVKIRVLQEFEEESPGYDERRGTMTIIEEHASPKNFKITAKCTAEDEGRCWACEQQSNPEIGKKWSPKLRFYTNVLVRNPDGEDKVKLWKRGFSDKDIGNDLLNIVEEFEQLSDKDLKLARKGSEMNNTVYSLLPLAVKPLSKADQAVELIDPNKFIKVIPYNEQAAFYAGETNDESGSASSWLSE